MTKSQILDFLKSHRRELENDFGVVKIGLFGSYAQGTATPSSDIDIAVELRRENKGNNYFRLLHFLEDNLHRKIDLGIESALKPAVAEQLKDEIVYV